MHSRQTCRAAVCPLQAGLLPKPSVRLGKKARHQYFRVVYALMKQRFHFSPLKPLQSGIVVLAADVLAGFLQLHEMCLF